MKFLDRSDMKACHERLCNGSRSFYAASFLLPRAVRDPAAALYAFCRVADDAIDDGTSSERTVDELRARLAAIYAGNPADAPEDRAFACVVEHFAIPRALPEALLEGFEWDIQERIYDDIEQVHAYSARVAGTVGAMMAVIMGAREPGVIARACELGMAMQLTNIARDVGEDAREGRLYLPRNWMVEAGIDPDAWLQAPEQSDALASVIERLLATADELYLKADSGIAELPADCQTGIRSASMIYSEIGREVQRCNLDSVSRRAVVPASRKLALIWRAAKEQGTAEQVQAEAPPEAAQFLIDAVAASSRPEHVPINLPPAWWEISKRMEWTVELFERLDQRDQSQREQDLYFNPVLQSRSDG